jgi:hypothetical protein
MAQVRGSVIPTGPQVTLQDFQQVLLFELCNESLDNKTYNTSPAARAWNNFRDSSFCTAWAAQCTASGLPVEGLERMEGGIYMPVTTCNSKVEGDFIFPGDLDAGDAGDPWSADAWKEIRFQSNDQTITGDTWDIQTRSRFTEGQEWSLSELLILKDSFVTVMETSMESRDATGALIDGKPRVRARLLGVGNKARDGK